jgi:hypothetical protein
VFLQAPGKDRVGLREEQTIVRAGHNSRVGRLINRKSVIGTKLSKTDYLTVMTGLMEFLAREGLVSRVDIEADLQGWRLSPSAVRIVPLGFRNGFYLGRSHFEFAVLDGWGGVGGPVGDSMALSACALSAWPARCSGESANLFSAARHIASARPPAGMINRDWRRRSRAAPGKRTSKLGLALTECLPQP